MKYKNNIHWYKKMQNHLEIKRIQINLYKKWKYKWKEEISRNYLTETNIIEILRN